MTLCIILVNEFATFLINARDRASQIVYPFINEDED